MLNFDRNKRCDYCGTKAEHEHEEFIQCDECDWTGHSDDCHTEHYTTTHESTYENTNDEVDENIEVEEYDENMNGGTEQSF
jgi:hypothetical protein